MFVKYCDKNISGNVSVTLEKALKVKFIVIGFTLNTVTLNDNFNKETDCLEFKCLGKQLV
jgi:hypothetical protein